MFSIQFLFKSTEVIHKKKENCIVSVFEWLYVKKHTTIAFFIKILVYLDLIQKTTQVTTRGNTTQHEYNTRQYDTTRVQYETRQDNTSTTRHNTSTTRDNTTQHDCNTTQHKTTRIQYDKKRVKHETTRVKRKL